MKEADAFTGFIENAITWARERIGSTEYCLQCLAFMEDALERSNGIEIFGGNWAEESAELYGAGDNTGQPPRGAFVFYHCLGQIDGEIKDWGHGGLSLGEGLVIHAWDRVRVDGYLDIENLAPAPGWTRPEYIGWVPIEIVLKGHVEKDYPTNENKGPGRQPRVDFIPIQQGDLALRQATREDAPILGRWWRDGEVMAHAGFPRGLDITDEEIVAHLAQGSDEAGRVLIIEVGGTPIGEMSYRNQGDKVAEIGIKICDKSHQGKGLGPVFLSLLIAALFTDLGFEKIILDTNLNNTRAQHVYEKLGFTRVGINVDAWRDQLGQLQSAVDYELTKCEWSKKNK